MYRFSFVILHYLSYDATAACVDSVLNISGRTPHPESRIDIIVVDNSSPNDSMARLQEHFAGSDCIHFLHAGENLGFARGNNLGYRYALDKLHADFIIIANNDTCFSQQDFLPTLLSAYEQTATKPALIGPDIRSVNGFHQNPYRDHIITRPEINRWIRNRRLWTAFLYMDKFLHLSKHIRFFQDYYMRRSLSGKPNESWQTEAVNVVLQGACIIFTPVFTAHFAEYAFYPATFMYCEEDIICWLCVRQGLTTYYTPALYLDHMEAVSTALSMGESTIEKELFLSRNILKSLKILRQLHKKRL